MVRDPYAIHSPTIEAVTIFEHDDLFMSYRPPKFVTEFPKISLRAASQVLRQNLPELSELQSDE